MTVPGTWPEVFEVIRIAVVMAAGVVDGLVVDADGPQPYAPEVLIRLRPIADVHVEPKAQWILGPPNAETGLCTRTGYQQRQVTISCKVEAISSGVAQEYALRIIEGFGRLGPEDPVTTFPDGPRPWLESCEVPFVKAMGPINAGTYQPGNADGGDSVDGRILSVYTVDLMFRYMRVTTDTPVRTIATVPLTLREIP